MNRVYVLLIFVLIMPLAYSQAWKDSLRLGQELYQNGDYEASYKTIMSAQKIAPADIDLSQDIGNAAYRAGDFEMAEKAYKSSASNEKEAQVKSKKWHNVGNSQMQVENFEGAIESYKESLRLDSSNEEARYNLAEAQRRVQLQNQEQQNMPSQQQDGGDAGDMANQDQSEGQDDNQEGDEQESEGQSSEQEDEEDKGDIEGRLSDLKTDRVLDDLLRQEIETKKKVRRMEEAEKGQGTNSGKRW